MDPTPLPAIPRNGDERAQITGFLDYQRAVMARKLEGVDREGLVGRLEPGVLTLGGIIRHLTEVERWWFRAVFAGEEDLEFAWSDEDPDGEFRVPEEATADALVAAYLQECARSRRIAAAADLDAAAAKGPGDRDPVSLRWVLLHMIEETARHAGHADLLREAADGSVGD